ncbi:two component transcriptional regulator, AraC family [Desulfitobacterium hafniense DCB-2]|uniref:Stage 0 sporulation protein A homolog n=2 Tax=root TaxID=1 RepID=B8FSX6_DESHD|nr:response regulator [Desulfitobacterium hafniense]ACL21992.1 two component transcriptional regulator, AraC family [Desulfitobacterium hafniense DCB-2]MEA5022367.1 response regulator [Desulfitobacterium hafniense]
MYTVLVADDKEVFRRKVKRMPYFQDHKEKFAIRYEAQNGLEALEILRSHDVDMVLTDIRMPFIDGIELLKHVNAENLCKCVILLSEFAEFNYAKAGILNGAFDYVLKPVDDEKIQETFDRAYNYLTTINAAVNAQTQRIETLARLMLAGDRMNALAYAKHIGAGLQAHGAITGERIVQANDTLAQLNKYILQKRPFLHYYLPFDELCCLDAKKTTPGKISDAFNACVSTVMDAIEPFCVQSTNELVGRTCQLVLEKLDSKVSLHGIADNLYVNPKYLGALFKKETGRSFVDYVTFARMERAKMLLRNPTLKVYEVAAQLGYDDVDYFSKVFKKLTAESPSIYREMRKQ